MSFRIWKVKYTGKKVNFALLPAMKAHEVQRYSSTLSLTNAEVAGHSNSIVTLMQLCAFVGLNCNYCNTLSLTSALDVVGVQNHTPAALPPRTTRCPLHRRLGGIEDRSGGRSGGRSGWMQKTISPTPMSFESRSVQPKGVATLTELPSILTNYKCVENTDIIY